MRRKIFANFGRWRHQPIEHTRFWDKTSISFGLLITDEVCTICQLLLNVFRSAKTPTDRAWEGKFHLLRALRQSRNFGIRKSLSSSRSGNVCRPNNSHDKFCLAQNLFLSSSSMESMRSIFANYVFDTNHIFRNRHLARCALDRVSVRDLSFNRS